MMSIVVLLIVAIAIVAGVVVAVSRSRGRDQQPGRPAEAAAVRQFFQYLLLLALLIIAGVGVTGLLGRLFDPGNELLREPSALARDLTFTIIGLPLFLGLGEWTRRRLRRNPEEQGAWWIAYLTIASTVTLIMAFPAVHELLMALVGIYDSWSENLAPALVWTGAWVGHWWIGRRYARRAQLQPRALIGSLIGLVLTSLGLGGLLAQGLNVLFGVDSLNTYLTASQRVLEPAMLLLVGAAIWAVHWLAEAAHGIRGKLWLAYVLLPGLGGGLVAALIGASLLLHRGLVWFIGDPRSGDPEEHFRPASAFLAAVVVGLLVWWYHQRVLATRPQERSEVRRVLEYLLAGIGLLAAGAGLTMVIVAIFELLAGNVERLIGTGAINTVLAALTLLVVGLPVWWLYWRQIGRATLADQTGELASPTRRVYLLVLFGIAGIAAVGALLALVYLLFADALEGGLTGETLRRIRYPVGILLTTAGISAYHWTVFRADRQHQPHTSAEPVVPQRVLTLIGPPEPMLVAEVANQTGARVNLLLRQDAEGLAWVVDDVMAAVAEAQGSDLVIIARPAGLHVISIGPTPVEERETSVSEPPAMVEERETSVPKPSDG